MSDSLWTSDEILTATGGRMTAPFAATGINFDTRALQPGDLFLALKGARDGHDFVAMAAERRAAAALVERHLDVDLPQVIVPDVMAALGQIATAARERARKRIAVTGSVGKTSVTQVILKALHLAGSAHGSVKSFNNHIGAPITLARTPRDTAAAVFELGMNHPGEIAPLARLVAPHVALITTVAAVHAEAFADETAIADEKAAIFDGLVHGGVAVIPADNPHTARLDAHARALGVKVQNFGAAGQEARLISATEAVDHVMVTAEVLGVVRQFRVGAPGKHWAQNALAILLVLAAIDVDLVHGFTALEVYRPLAGRGAVATVPVADGQITLIDDSYNANPASMRAAFSTFAQYPGRKIAVLTDMLELGSMAEAEHRALAAPLLTAGVDAVFCAGPAMRALFDALPKSRQASWKDRADDLVSDIKAELKNGDVVLVKGSNGSRAGAIVTALTAHKGECVDVV